MRTKTIANLRRSAVFGAVAVAVLAGGTSTASAASHHVAQAYCPASEVQQVWDGGAQHRWSFESCGDLAAQFDHMFYPGVMYSTAYAQTYRVSVVEIQLRLRDLNYSPLVIDGRYGQQTAGAISRYQRNHHLVVDGKVGLQTWRALFGLGSA